MSKIWGGGAKYVLSPPRSNVWMGSVPLKIGTLLMLGFYGQTTRDESFRWARVEPSEEKPASPGTPLACALTYGFLHLFACVTTQYIYTCICVCVCVHSVGAFVWTHKKGTQVILEGSTSNRGNSTYIGTPIEMHRSCTSTDLYGQAVTTTQQGCFRPA